MNRIATTAAAAGATTAATGTTAAAGPAATVEGGATEPTRACPCATGQGATGPSRRRVVTTGALGALAATALAACGGDDEPAATTPSSAGGAPQTTTEGGGVIAKVADVPVGGAVPGRTADGVKIILSRPEAGTVVAFDARCPHQGCTVAPSGDTLRCPCHGSTFQTSDGAVINGPATSGLATVPVSVSGDDIVAG
jgi:cytochrome b6-f complex iron-sulfur subunit